jgi:hypothetical protein
MIVINGREKFASQISRVSTKRKRVVWTGRIEFWFPTSISRAVWETYMCERYAIMNIGRPSIAGKEAVLRHNYVIKVRKPSISDCWDNECESRSFHQRMFRNVQNPPVGNN